MGKRKRKQGTRSISIRTIGTLGLVLGSALLIGVWLLTKEMSTTEGLQYPPETTGQFQEYPPDSEVRPVLEIPAFDPDALCLFWTDSATVNSRYGPYQSHWMEVETGKQQDAQLMFPTLAERKSEDAPFEIEILSIPKDNARDNSIREPWLVFRRGTALQFVLRAKGVVHKWSPDKNLVAISWNYYQQQGVIIADRAGKVLHNYKVEANSTFLAAVNWSSDQKYLLSDNSRNIDGQKYHISYTLSVNDGSYRTIVTPTTGLYWKWSPVGHLLVTFRDLPKEKSIMFLDTEKGAVQRFSVPPEEMNFWHNNDATWSPDGQWLTYPVHAVKEEIKQHYQYIDYLVALGVNGKRMTLNVPNSDGLRLGHWLADSTLTFTLYSGVDQSNLYAWRIPDSNPVATLLAKNINDAATWTSSTNGLVPIVSGIDPATGKQASWESDPQNGSLKSLPFIGGWQYQTADGRYLFNIINDPNVYKKVSPDTPERVVIQRYSVAEQQITEYVLGASTLWFDQWPPNSGYNPILAGYGDWFSMRYEKRDAPRTTYNDRGQPIWFNVKTGIFKPQLGEILRESTYPVVPTQKPSPLVLTQKMTYSPFKGSSRSPAEIPLTDPRGRDNDLQHITVYTRNIEQVASYTFRHECLQPSDFHCTTTLLLSPDGQHLLYIEQRTDNYKRVVGEVRLVLARSGINDTTLIARETNLITAYGHSASIRAQWSSDGRYFVVERTSDYDNYIVPVGQLEIYDANGTRRWSQYWVINGPMQVTLQACGIPYLLQPSGIN